MGLIRKSLFVSTGGVVAPNSKKQKVARQTLAAARGRSDAEVSRAGTRRAALGFTGAPTPYLALAQPATTPRALICALENEHADLLPAEMSACKKQFSRARRSGYSDTEAARWFRQAAAKIRKGKAAEAPTL